MVKRSQAAALVDFLGPAFAHESSDVIPIHVAKHPHERVALCGSPSLPFAAYPERVELGARRRDGSIVTLDEVELEAGWIGSQIRHREAVKLGDMCRGCLECVARLRAKVARPLIAKQELAERRAARSAKRAAARAERDQATVDRKAQRAAAKAARAQAAADAKAQRQAQRAAAWTERMLEGE